MSAYETIRSGLFGLTMTLLAPLVLAQAAAPEPLVSVAAVSRQSLDRNIPISGTVFSRYDVEMSAQQEGELDWVAEPGARVASGELVARLDAGRLQLRRQELQQLAGREDANLTFLDKEVGRLSALQESHNVSVTQLDESIARRDISRHDLKVIESRIEQVDDQIARSEIRARFDGVVAERRRETGEYVRAGEVVARLVDINSLELRVAVPISYAQRIRIGDVLPLELASEQQFSGPIRSIVPAGDPVSQTFEVRIDLPADGRGAILVGQLAKAYLGVQGNPDTLVVPRDAIVIRRDGSFVYRINAESVAERVNVNVGEGRGAIVAVEGELQVGDRVAIRGAETLNAGQLVKVPG